MKAVVVCNPNHEYTMKIYINETDGMLLLHPKYFDYFRYKCLPVTC